MSVDSNTQLRITRIKSATDIIQSCMEHKVDIEPDGKVVALFDKAVQYLDQELS